MTTAVAQDLRQQLLEELDWEPRLGTSQVDVTISDHGVVTLTGLVKSYAEKVAAERATRRVRGVHATRPDHFQRLQKDWSCWSVGSALATNA